MTTHVRTENPPFRRLRVWPGVAAVAAQWLIRFGTPLIAPDEVGFAIVGSIICAALVLIWWLFLSRAPWRERLVVVLVIAAAMLLGSRIVHESVAGGAMGMLYFIMAIPGLCLALVVWAVISQHLSPTPRQVAMVASILVAAGLWGLVRTGGFTGSFDHDLHWRWTPTAEEKLLAKTNHPLVPASTVSTVPAKAPEATPTTTEIKPAEKAEIPLPAEPAAQWQGFRGRERNGIVSGILIETNWSAVPPETLWKREIGPGWSSFAVRGDVFYTQEQRGPDEVVACYKLSTGEQVWMHRDRARFWESNAGAGPRGTPALGGNVIYTFGATGIVNALNASNGTLLWSRNAAAETRTETPEWGFSSSPLLFNDLVIVAVSGQLAAYDRKTGDPRWTGPRGGISYSSPHLLTTNDIPQVLLLSRNGMTSVSPATGKLLWEHEWKGHPIVQPALTRDGDVLISVGESSGIRRLTVEQNEGTWKVEERWTSSGLKPYFNDFVVHKGHAYGFDGSILSCIDLSDGKRKWKGGRYGHGQMVLLADQDLLVLLSEDGELALVRAAADAYTELARIPAIEGKTWNHPVVAGDVLLARNGEQMAAFRLARANR